MKRSVSDENGEIKRSSVKQESMNFGYETGYSDYVASTPSVINQPLPGQPPLPPMPPPSNGIPPPPHVFGVSSQVAQIQTWAHPSSPWQWITPQTSPLPPHSREITTNAFQRDLPVRGNYVRRERFPHIRNNIYAQRNNFHRKNRRFSRFDQSQGQFDQTAYFNSAIAGNLGLEWQRGPYSVASNDSIMGCIAVPFPNSTSSLPPGMMPGRHNEEAANKDDKILLEEVVIKKTKQRKPMSQSYPSRPWNRDDAERALKIENEYNKTVKAQSLIIKFPDPDLNKDIVKKFHPGIQNIHFQSPSGPRYCFIQMAENVDIDTAIGELEQISFGVGNLKVERKSLRDEDNPMPEEIDPYTLYIGNLPESVNVEEVKSKFPTAARLDVGYAQKMRNTRYAFIRYNSVDESISAYKKAHDLMWDTRSIIVRFRRQRGNKCLPGEPKPNLKKTKAEVQTSPPATERSITFNKKNSTDLDHKEQNLSTGISKEKTNELLQDSQNCAIISSSTTNNTSSHEPKQLNLQKTNSSDNVDSSTKVQGLQDVQSDKEAIMLTEIKPEPEDYEEMSMSCNDNDNDDDDDDDDDDDEDVEEDENDDDDDEDEEPDISDNESENQKHGDEIQRVYRGETITTCNTRITTQDEMSDHLDQMFNDLETMAGDVGF